MPTVGELAVELDARTKEFNARIQGAEHRIRQFEGKATGGTKAAAGGFKSLLGPIAAVAGALAALGATRALIGIASGATQSAAAFESYGVRLKALLGSQEAANKSLEGFVTLSTRTPFAVEQIVGGATTLASVAGGSREELDKLTKTSANLAAVTGLGFAEASGNLQRALASGIGAADLFRERGVRKLIEDVNGIPDLTKIPLEEQRELFYKTFGPEATAPYGTAAEDLSRTLGGALSNIGDAAANAKRSVGDALAPGVFGAAKSVIIPLFEELKGWIDDNSEAITDFVVRGIAGAVRGFASLLETGADILGFLRDLRIDFSDIGDLVGIVWNGFKAFFEAVRLGFNTIVAGVALLAEGIGKVGRALGLVSEEDARLLERFRKESFDKVAQGADEYGKKAKAIFEENKKLLGDLADQGEDYSAELEDAAKWARQGADNLEAQATAFRRAREQQARAEDEAAAAAARAAAGPRAYTPEELKARLEQRENRKLAEEAWARYQAIIEGGKSTAEAAFSEITQRSLDTFSGSMTDGLLDLAHGEGVTSFAEGLAETSAGWLDDALRNVLDNLIQQLQDALAGAAQEGTPAGGGGWGGFFSSLFASRQETPAAGGTGEGGTNWGAGIAAAAGLGSAILTGALRGTDVSVSNPAIRSAVTSTQNVRGIVAGPTSIPIAQVGNAIRDAQGEQVAELRRGNKLLEGILNAVRARGAGVDVSDLVADAIAGEMAGSVALG